MNEELLTEMFIWDINRRFLEMLMTSVLAGIVLLSLAVLILILCLCWETTRARWQKTRSEQPSALRAGLPDECSNALHPA